MPEGKEYKKGIYTNLVEAYGKDNLPDENTFYQKIDNDASYRKGVYSNLENAYGKDNLPTYDAYEAKFKKKETTPPTSKPLSNGAATQVPTSTPLASKEKIDGIPIVPDDVSTAKLKVVEYGGMDKPPARGMLNTVKEDWFKNKVGQMDDKTLLNSYVAYGTDKDFFGNLQGNDPITKEINRRLQTGIIKSPYKTAAEYLQATINHKSSKAVNDNGTINDVTKVYSDYNADNKKAYKKDVAKVWSDIDANIANEKKVAEDKLKLQKVATPKINPNNSDINAMLPSSQEREFMAAKGTGDAKLLKAIDEYANKSGENKDDIIIQNIGGTNNKKLFLKKGDELVPMVFDEKSGKIGEKGGFWSMAAQSIGESVRNTANGLDISNAIENENNPNKALYLAKEFQRGEENMPKKVSGAVGDNILGNAGELGGGFVPYAHPLSLGITSVYGNVNANAQRILQDESLTDEQKSDAIRKTTKTAQDIGLLETMGFEAPKVLGALKGTAEAANLLNRYKPTAALRQELNSAVGQMNTILKETPTNVAHLFSVGAGKEALNVLNIKDAGVKADFSNVGEEGLGLAKLALGMNMGRVLMLGLKKLGTAKQAQVDKSDPTWYNKYDKAVTGQLVDIVSQPDYIYNRIIKDLSDMPDMPETKMAKDKIKTFKSYYDALPKELTDEQKSKALHILQSKTEAVGDYNEAKKMAETNPMYESIAKMHEEKAKQYDKLLQKIVTEPKEDAPQLALPSTEKINTATNEPTPRPETQVEKEGEITPNEGDESTPTPATIDTPKESSVAEKVVGETIQPTAENKALSSVEETKDIEKELADFNSSNPAEKEQKIEQLKNNIKVLEKALTKFKGNVEYKDGGNKKDITNQLNLSKKLLEKITTEPPTAQVTEPLTKEQGGVGSEGNSALKEGKVQWDKNKNYRVVDNANDAVGNDVSFKKGEPFDDGVFTLEFNEDLQGNSIEHHENSMRGDISKSKPDKIYFNTEELSPQNLEKELSNLKNKFPNAEYIPIRLNDDTLEPEYDYGYNESTELQAKPQEQGNSASPKVSEVKSESSASIPALKTENTTEQKVEKVITKKVDSIEPPLPKGETMVTPNGLTEPERQKLIEQRRKTTQLTQEEITENKLVALNKKRNAKGQLPTIKRDITSKIQQIVRTLNAELGYEKYRSDKFTVSKATTVRKGIIKGNRRFKQLTETNRDMGNGSILDNSKVFVDRDIAVRENYDALMDDGMLKHLDIKDASGVKSMSEVQIEAAIDDIENGIPSVGADNLLNVIEQATKDGRLPIIENGYKIDIPLDEVLKVEKEVVGEPFDEENLNKWIEEQSHNLTDEQLEVLDNDLNDIIYEYEQGDIETEIPTTQSSTETTSDTKVEPKVGDKPTTKTEPTPTKERTVASRVLEKVIADIKKEGLSVALGLPTIKDYNEVNKQGGNFDDFVVKTLEGIKTLIDAGQDVTEAIIKAVDSIVAAYENAKVKDVSREQVENAIIDNTITDAAERAAMKQKLKENAESTYLNSEGKRVVSIANDPMRKFREENGLPPIEELVSVKNETVFNRVAAKFNENPSYDLDIIAQIQNGTLPFTEVTDAQVALNIGLAKSQFELSEATRKLAEVRTENNNSYQEVGLLLDIDRLHTDITLNNQSSQLIGSHLGRGLQVRQVLLSESYSPEIVNERLEASFKGGKVPKEVQERMDFLVSKNQRLMNEMMLANKSSSRDKAQDAINKEARKQQNREKAKTNTVNALRDFATQKRLEVERDRFEKGANGEVQANGITLNDLKLLQADLADGLAKALEKTNELAIAIEEAVKSIKNKPDDVDLRGEVEKMIVDMASDKVKEANKDLFDSIKEQAQNKNADEPYEITDDMAKDIKSVMKNLVSNGITDANTIVNHIYDNIKDTLNIDKADVEEALTNYGRYRPRTKDVDEINLRNVKAAILLNTKIARLEKGIELEKNLGDKQKKEIALEDAKNKLDNLLRILKQGKYSDEARNEAAQKSAQKSIDDLQDKIDNNELEIEKAVKLNETQKTKELREKRDDLRKEIEQKRKDAKVGKYSDEARIKASEKRREDILAELTTQRNKLLKDIKEGNYEPIDESITEPSPQSKKMLELSNSITKTRAEIEKIIYDEEWKNRPRGEKIKEWMAELLKVMPVAGIDVYGKLGLAASWNMVFRPIDWAAKSIIRGTLKLAEKLGSTKAETILNKAERESAVTFGSIKAGAKAVFSRNVAREVLQIFLHGHNPYTLENYVDEAPKKTRTLFAKYVYNSHAAIKYLPKKVEFETSFKKRWDAGVRNGENVNDLMFIEKIKIQALEDGLRSIFMNRNVISQSVSRAMTGFSGVKSKASHLEVNEGYENGGSTTNAVSILKDYFFPVTKVPVNYALESASYLPIIGGIRAYHKLTTKSFEKISPADADLVIRLLSRQITGVGLYFLGMLLHSQLGGHRDYSRMYPTKDEKEKADEIKPEEIEVDGTEISHQLTHNPLFWIFQSGATAGEILENKGVDQSSFKAYALGMVAPEQFEALFINSYDIAHQIPFVGGTEDMFKSSFMRGKDKSIGQYMGGSFLNRMTPTFLKNIAKKQKPEDAKFNPKSAMEEWYVNLPFMWKNVGLKETRRGKNSSKTGSSFVY